jgi:hypothetical protein
VPLRQRLAVRKVLPPLGPVLMGSTATTTFRD